MPQLKKALTKYSHHKPSGRAYVTLNGQKVYLGPYESRISRVEYDRVVAEWLANGRRLPSAALPVDWRRDLRVVELIECYLDHAREYYCGPDRKPNVPLYARH